MPSQKEPKDLQRGLAKFCKDRCPICRRARAKQRGVAYVLTRYIDAPVCPACRSYKAVYGRASYEPEEA